MSTSVQAKILARLEERPERRSLGFMNHRGETAWLTREQFHQRAARRATALFALGLREGQVCVIVSASDDSCAAVLSGVLHLGAIPLVVPAPIVRGRQTFDVVRTAIRKARPSLVVCPDWMAELAAEFASGRKTRYVFDSRQLDAEGLEGHPAASPNGDDIVALQLTSGTMGSPRICAWKHADVLAALDSAAAAIGLAPEDVCFNWTPLYHDLGLASNLFLCLTRGTPLVTMNAYDFVKRPKLWIQGLSRTKATVTWSPNFGLAVSANRVRDSDLTDTALDRVRVIWNAAERVHRSTMLRFYDRFAPYGLRFDALKTSFGCSENITGVTFTRLEESCSFEHVDGRALQARRIATLVDPDHPEAVCVAGVGRPAPGIDVKVVSRVGRELPEGHVGEISWATSFAMTGYLRDLRATRFVLRGGNLRSGDLGYLRDGELYWVGRTHEVINVRGRKFDPSDFEAALTGIPGLRDGCFAAFGVDDENSGTQRVVIVAEVRAAVESGFDDIVAAILRSAIESPGVEVGEVLLVPAGTLHKTSSGKRRHRFAHGLFADGALDDKALTRYSSMRGSPRADRPRESTAGAGSLPTL